MYFVTLVTERSTIESIARKIQNKYLKMGGSFGKLMVLLILFNCLVVSNLVSQNRSKTLDQERVYYDHELDCFPRIKSICLDTLAFRNRIFRGELKEAIEQLLDKLRFQQYSIKKMSGIIMQESSAYPIELTKYPMCMQVIISQEGEVESLDIWRSRGSGFFDETLEEELFQLLRFSKIKPSLIRSIPVKSKFFYTIDVAEH